jgi:DNA-binding NarL/FixJ family response regulator
MILNGNRFVIPYTTKYQRMDNIAVIIVSDYKLFREGLKLLFRDWPELRVLDDFDWRSVTAQRLAELAAPIIIIDLDSVQDQECRRLIISPIRSSSKVVAVWSEYRKEVISGLKIDGYHSKYSGSSELRALLISLATGSRRRKGTTRAAANDLPGAEAAGLLSMREVQIGTLVAHGFTSKEIAIHLSVSAKTIEAHRHNIFKKLKISKTSALVNFLTTGRTLVTHPGILGDLT